MMNRRACLRAALGALLLLWSAPSARAALTPDEASAIAAEGYVYGYPLVLMDMTRAIMTATPRAGTARAPINQFAHKTNVPDANFTDVVSPNADTLSSSAWLDLTAEPIVLSVPDTGGRYYLMQMLDAWTTVFAAPGKRTTGTRPGAFAICGPGWHGKLPSGVQAIRAPSAMVWLIGRTQTNGKADAAAVHALQAQFRLTPLSAWGTPYTPPAVVAVDETVDPESVPAEQVVAMDGALFFTRLAALMATNPPAKADAPMLAKLARIGVVPGQPFAPDPALLPDIDAGVKAAQADLAGAARSTLSGANGWVVRRGLGNYGTDYATRAEVALVGLGATLDADAIDAATRRDAAGQTLTGARRYVLHFAAGQLPPTNAFWSLSVYDDRQSFVANPLDRYSLGDRDPLTFNADGSLDLYVQHASPGAAQEANWLPAPTGPFNVILRVYWPKAALLDGTYQLPPLRRAE